MIQINDDFYEDLTPETVVNLIEALRESVKVGKNIELPAAGPLHHPGNPPTSSVKAGPLTGRSTCENSAGQTNLLEKPWGVEKTRADL